VSLENERFQNQRIYGTNIKKRFEREDYGANICPPFPFVQCSLFSPFQAFWYPEHRTAPHSLRDSPVMHAMRLLSTLVVLALIAGKKVYTRSFLNIESLHKIIEKPEDIWHIRKYQIS
jgi:hypothetical protein